MDAESYPVDNMEGLAPSPDVALEGGERQQRILAALDELDPEQRALITLHLLEGYTLVEVAGIMDTPLGTLKSRLHRSKEKLKKSLILEPFSTN